MTTRNPLPSQSATACCGPALAPGLSRDDAALLAARFRALGDPTRLRLLSLIAGTTGDEACICDLTGPVGLSQPTVSHHMKKLVDAGLVEREQRGRWAYYRLVPDALAGLAGSLTTPAKTTAS